MDHLENTSIIIEKSVLGFLTPFAASLILPPIVGPLCSGRKALTATFWS